VDCTKIIAIIKSVKLRSNVHSTGLYIGTFISSKEKMDFSLCFPQETHYPNLCKRWVSKLSQLQLKSMHVGVSFALTR